jgi:hypothetical protein
MFFCAKICFVRAVKNFMSLSILKKFRVFRDMLYLNVKNMFLGAKTCFVILKKIFMVLYDMLYT